MPYGYIDIKKFLGMQKRHDYILSQQEARKKYDKSDEIDDLTVIKVDAIHMGTTLVWIHYIWLTIQKTMAAII